LFTRILILDVIPTLAIATVREPFSGLFKKTNYIQSSSHLAGYAAIVKPSYRLHHSPGQMADLTIDPFAYLRLPLSVAAMMTVFCHVARLAPVVSIPTWHGDRRQMLSGGTAWKADRR